MSEVMEYIVAATTVLNTMCNVNQVYVQLASEILGSLI